QDVLHTTSGIAVKGDTGIMVVNAGHDVNLGAATLEALGKEGAIVITAGHDVNSTTDTVSTADMPHFGVSGDNVKGHIDSDYKSVTQQAGIHVGAISKELAKHPHSTIDEQGRYIDNSDVYKLVSAVLGGAITNSSLGSGIVISATENNLLTHEQQIAYLKELSEARNDAEREAIKAKWKEIDRQQSRMVNQDLWDIQKNIIKNQIDEHDLEKRLEVIKAIEAYLVEKGFGIDTDKLIGINRTGKLHAEYLDINITVYNKKLGPIDSLVLGWTIENEKTALNKLRNKGLNPMDRKNAESLAQEYIKARDASIDLMGLLHPNLLLESYGVKVGSQLVKYRNNSRFINRILKQITGEDISVSIKSQSKATINPLQNTTYTPKVMKQMSKSNDRYHAFPKEVDLFAKYGKIEEKVGNDGIKRTWIELEGSYKGQKGIFEYIIEADNTINHRFFRVK
ncbi:MAG: hypothetical protein SPG03_05400, partial [Veillonella caviae]|nr:hypothetical protein [Veillonella caviae]